MIKRIFVEKKHGFDEEARKLQKEFTEFLGVSSIKKVRVFCRYDIEGLTDAELENAKYTVFSEKTVDILYDENMPAIEETSKVFAVSFLPGQYDQRADSAEACLRMLKPACRAVVKFARIIAITGDISQKELEKIKKHMINPVESEEVSLEKPESLERKINHPEKTKRITGFCSFSNEELENYRKEMGFAMSTADIQILQDYFKNEEKRDPSITELLVIDTYWSDHCRHTTFMTELTDIEFGNDEYSKIVNEEFEKYLKIRKDVYGEHIAEKPVCLMDMACIGTKAIKKAGLAEDLDQSEEINACSIKVKADVEGKEEDWTIMFKNETHNHPTEIEPFGGAATCLGGAIRDPLSGRSYVYQAMRVTGAADPRKSLDETLEGKLPQRKICQGAATGYSSYGNQIGLATGQVTELYHPGYAAKRMEIGAVIAATRSENIVRKRPEAGDVILLVGGRTGKDGIGGASGSSKEHDVKSIEDCGSEVQKGNPLTERALQRLFRRKDAATLIKRCNDFGAGGVCVAVGELADSIKVNLDAVLTKYDGLSATEKAISESQERMAVVVAKEDEGKFKKIADEENLEATRVAEVTNNARYQMLAEGETILDLSREFLDKNGAKQTAKVNVENEEAIDKLKNYEKREFVSYLSDLNCASQKGLTERFDSSIGAGTVIMPLGGKKQLTPQMGMVAKLPVYTGNTNTATAMTFGFDPKIAEKSPFHSAVYALLDAATKMTALGADYKKIRYSLQEYFEKLGEDSKAWAKPFEALLGALKVQMELGLPAIGGKDSMSGSFMELSVPPTLVAFAVATMKASEAVSSELTAAGSQLVLLETPFDKQMLPNFEIFKKNMELAQKLMSEGKVLSASNVGHGGIFVSLLKMAAGNEIGVELEIKNEEAFTRSAYGSLILEIKEGESIEELFGDSNFTLFGKTKAENLFSVEFTEYGCSEHITYKLDELIERWQAPLEDVYPTRTDGAYTEEAKNINYEGNRIAVSAKGKFAAPRVVIPVFPGTNCEVDTKRAFEAAGGDAHIVLIRNLTEQNILDSIDELETQIKQSQIICIPGGFSGGDEPDGSARFIASFFRNAKITGAVTELLEKRDGLMLGICNGFQALIKLGLVPYGKITDIDEASPTLTYNKIARHASCMVRTRVASVKSPWLAHANVGDISHVPISHGEGRFVASEDVLNKLVENGQVATQYVDLEGNASMDISFNPNGSKYAIEGICSPDGRIFGKMGHSERYGQDLYKNVFESDQYKIFASGVKYFR